MVCQSAQPASSPAPRFRARSMLSLGTDVFLAFWMASYSVGLPAGSPPPVRAATSMFLISRANSLPRRASLTAFWCLVVAHLEWPLMPSYLNSSYFLARRVYVDDGGGWPAAPLAAQHSQVSQELRDMPVRKFDSASSSAFQSHVPPDPQATPLTMSTNKWWMR